MKIDLLSFLNTPLAPEHKEFLDRVYNEISGYGLYTKERLYNSNVCITRASQGVSHDMEGYHLITISYAVDLDQEKKIEFYLADELDAAKETTKDVPEKTYNKLFFMVRNDVGLEVSCLYLPYPMEMKDAIAYICSNPNYEAYFPNGWGVMEMDGHPVFWDKVQADVYAKRYNDKLEPTYDRVYAIEPTKNATSGWGVIEIQVSYSDGIAMHLTRKTSLRL